MTDGAVANGRTRRWTWWLVRGLALLGLLAAAAVAAFLIWAMTPLGPAPEATAAMRSTSDVSFEDASDGLTFAPVGAPPTRGIVFYPGGRVDYRSYATLARDLASAGYLVVVTPMPLSLAVLAPNRAEKVIAAHPEVTRWMIAGHSLGGSMACTFVDGHPGAVQALALLASYPASSDDISIDKIGVVSLLGTRDTVVNQANWQAGVKLLPPSTVYRTIDGGNHAQFGSYGDQPGDSPATITATQQRRETVEAIRAVFPAR